MCLVLVGTVRGKGGHREQSLEIWLTYSPRKCQSLLCRYLAMPCAFKVGNKIDNIVIAMFSTRWLLQILGEDHFVKHKIV